MMRSLYSAISGLKNHQTMMDVIGNNIANVNTTGFKKSRVTFATALSQSLKGASSPDTNDPALYGGTNPMQVGLGATLGSIDQIMTAGSSQTTGNPTDMMIDGDNGFFVLDNAGQTVYSRAGAFTLDGDGNLVDPATGAIVQGQMYDADPASTDTPDFSTLSNIKIKIGDTAFGNTGSDGALTSYSIDQNGIITGVYTDNDTTSATYGQSTTHKIGQIAIANFANASGLENIGGSFYRPTNNSGTATLGAAGDNGTGTITTGSVEMSNVDLSQEMTNMIVAQRGFQANSRVITVSDSLLQELIDLKRQ
ncbi:flagellar hook-basal body complex protein [Desulfosporosinus sp. PR]|uniref:flagellar hook-basal body complex protein n=1 Tax=Candidatus Desulfosporosinus nitrosoreducens TaxID=3401928 RepID=UPI0027EFF6EF|nr:flagellar hook-basal body complex protein [Desulfosporosinus sp. PR]MDQ7096212.1 flagellar hook-basal body complex protein [Desulfosporosinus sp. PR]